MRTLASIYFATLVAASTAVAAPVEMHVACPLPEAQRMIVNPLPNGWWSTPIVDRLTGTAIERIGGEATLVCRYGNAGQVHMRQPPAQICTATRDGFRCSQASTGRLHSTGSFLAQQTYLFDLDVGALALADRGADVWFEAVTDGDLFLTPVNGAQLALGDGTDRGVAGCRSAAFSSTRIPVRAALGRFVCALTSDGRVSQFQVADLSGTSPRSLTIHYTTWN